MHSPLLPGALGVAAGFVLVGATADAPGPGSGGRGGATLLLAMLLGALLACVAGRSGTTRTFAVGLLVGVVAGARAGRCLCEGPFVRALDGGGTRLELEGTVHGADPPGRGGTTFVLDVDRYVDGTGPHARSLRLDALVPPGPESAATSDLVPGDRVRLAGLVDAIARPTNPGAYDARAAAARRGVDARLLLPDGRGIQTLRHGDGPGAWIARARQGAARALDAAFEPDDAGLLRSLCLGDRGALSDADRRRFREAGAAHILAISGSQVALLTAALLFLLRRLAVPSRIAAAVVLLATLLLVPFTGSAPPVVRSAVGFSLFLVGRLLGREPTGTVLLGLVAAGYAVLDPGAGADPGFRMSFAAAAGLILLGPRLRRVLVPERLALPGTPPPRALVRSALAAGLAAWVFSTPFAVAALGQAGFVAVPVGLLAVPLSTLVLVAGGAAAALKGVPIAGPALVRGVEAAMAALRAFLDLPARLGCATGPVEPPGASWFVVYVLALVGLARGGAKTAALCALVLVALLTDLARRAEPAAVAGVRLTLLDVGHGQAALLETNDGRRVLFDAGSRDRRDPADRVVLPALFALHATTLDLAVVSHADADHSGAIPRVLEEIPADTLVVPPRFDDAMRERLMATGVPMLAARDGDGLLAGSFGRVRVLGPGATAEPGTSENDDGLVIAIETPWGRVLLPGDLEAIGVERLLTAHPALATDVLVLPHHGHPGQGVERLVRATHPTTLLASTPPSAVAALPPGTLSTGALGALVVTLDDAGIRVRAPWDRRRGVGAEYDPAASPGGAPMRDPLSLATATALLVVVGLLAVRLRWLTRAGSTGAVVLGLVSVAAFGWPALAALLAPFLVATLAGKLPGGPEGEGPRTLRQVAANGVVSLVGAALGLAGVAIGGPIFLGGLAALGADTLATEIGTRYGGRPRDLLTLRPLASGESGGVTLAGLAASLAGGALAPLAYVMAASAGLASVLPVAAAGFAAGLADSALGAAVQRKGACSVCGAATEAALHCGVAPTLRAGRLRWLDNDLVNVANACVGAAAAVWWT